MRKLLIKISVAVTLIVIAIGVTHLFKNVILKEETIGFGTINVTLVTASGETLSKDVSFDEGEYLYDVLEKNYDVRSEDGSYGKILLDIGPIKTDFYSSYIAIYVDDEYALVGVSQIALKDGMKIRLEETKL